MNRGLYKVEFMAEYGGDLNVTQYAAHTYAEVEEKFHAKYKKFVILSITRMGSVED